MADTHKPNTPAKPDLEETHNVSSSHGQLGKSAAVSREKQIRENGTEPVPIWVFLLFGFALLAGGAIWGSTGTFMNYDELVAEGYQRGEAPGAGDVKVLTATALVAYMKKGKNIYSAKCGGCHQANGQGVAGACPTLVDTNWVIGKTSLAAGIVLHGLNGPIEVKGEVINGVMPSMRSGLTSEDLAGLLTYIRNSFGNETGDVVTLEMAQAALDQAEKRGTAPLTAETLLAEYNVDLPGDPIDPNQTVDLVTLEPVESAE